MARLTRSTSLVAILAATAFLALAPHAMAHADLMNAEPTPNTEIDETPERLLLDFSEPLEDTYTRIEVLDANETDHVERFTIPEDHRDHLEADLSPLPDGVYTVRWQALSSADGHTTSGSYLIGVNASLTDTGTPSPGTQDPGTGGDDQGPAPVGEGGPGEATVRGLGFLGASLAAGLPLFLLVAHGVDVPRSVRQRWSYLAIAGAGVAMLASVGLILALSGRIDSTSQAAISTIPGQNLALRALAFTAAGSLLFIGHHERGREHGLAFTAGGTLAALSGLLLTSLGSHAAAQGIGAGLAIMVDWTHQAAVAFWVSGVTALGIAGLSNTRESAGAQLIRRFSPLAVASVAIIIVTGLWASLDRLTSPGDLVGSLYGFALSTKVLLLVPLIGLGAYHRYRLLPQLEAPGNEARDVSMLRRSAFIELGLMVVVLVAAGFMATTSPPTAPDEAAPFATFDDALDADTPDPFAPDLSRSDLDTLTPDQAENITLNLLVPDQPDKLPQGDQPVWILLIDGTDGTPGPLTEATVTLEAWMPAHGHGTNQPERDPVHVHEGMYEGATHWMMPGAWELRFNVTLPDGSVLYYAPTLYVEQPGDPLDQRDPVHTFAGEGFQVDAFVSPDPVRVGVQNLTVRVTPMEGGFPENADVVVNLRSPDGGGEGTTVDLAPWREDAWSAEEAMFTDQGTWSVLLAFQGRSTYVEDTFQVEVASR